MQVFVVSHGTNIEGVFTSKELGVKSVVFSFHKLNPTHKEIPISAWETEVSVSWKQDGYDYNELFRIVETPLMNSVEHL